MKDGKPTNRDSKGGERMGLDDPAEMRAEVRDTVHRLNNLLTTVLVQSESILLEKPDDRIARRVESILQTAEEADRVLRQCRARMLDEEPSPSPSSDA